MPNYSTHSQPQEPTNPTPPATPPAVEGIGKSLTPFQRLSCLLRPEKADIFAIIAFAVAIGLLQLATPIAVQAIVNTLTFGGQLQALLVISMLLMLALGFAAALFCIQTLTVELLQQRLFIRLVADLTARLPMVKIEAYNSGHGPELVNRFFDIITIQKSAPKILIDALGTTLTVIVGLSILAVYHPLLLVFDIFLILIILVILFLPLKKGQRTAIDESSEKYAVAAWLEEIVRCPYTFRNGGSQQWILKTTDTLTRAWLSSRKAHFRVIFNQIISVQFLYVLSSVTLLGLGGWLVVQGSLSLGQLIAAEIIVSGIVYSVSKSGKHLETWYDLMSAVYKVNQLLEVPTQRTSGDTPTPQNNKGASLSFSHLSWLGASEHELCSCSDISILPGEKIAITGPCGLGKSSLVDLIWRLSEPTSGTIHLDSIDIRDLAIQPYREQVSIVKHIEIVNGSVRDNISLNRPFVSRDDVRRAISIAGLDNVISSLPQRLNTILLPHSETLSEDEQRRLMLARAIAGSPALLVVDSLFDQSSPHARETVFKGLLENDLHCTLLLVSDRPEVLNACDRTIHLQTPPVA